MNFAEVLTKDFLLTWEGRINRQRFWAYFLVYLAAYIVVSLVESVIGLSGILSTLFILATLFSSICVAIKRWHDVDKSGWWALIGLIPLVGGIIALVFNGFIKGTSGPNRFGEDPLGRCRRIWPPDAATPTVDRRRNPGGLYPTSEIASVSSEISRATAPSPRATRS